MSLSVRLDILKEAGQISPATYDRLAGTINWFRSGHGMVLGETNAAMFITHLAVALERVARGECVTAPDTMIISEIKQSDSFSPAQALLAGMETLWGIKLPDNEVWFILAHLCTLLETEGTANG